MRLPPLTELLTYKNERVVRYFCHLYPDFSHEKSTQLFQDLLAWMWLNAYRQTNKRSTYLFGPLLIVDKMWHTFILHTRDYVDFCYRHFNDYFHHHVEPAGFEHHLTAEELADFLQDCFEYLGENWVLRYFNDALDED
ncbi:MULTISPECIES: hypothetical protein [Legionella]|uniref:Uncharacterized conserved protein n=1 Tax=Legionella donaldsonii TaxID=45060 RepID=A0A378J9J2_9GAMM|nr:MULTISPECIES: hypothetical protein [Legionella]MCC5014043.1 hypothetical protein [Legionella sp. 31fI33]STX41240.1 Uncharacterized conserved protein [Legionella donaldsonii]